MKKTLMKWSLSLALVLAVTACSENSGMKNMLECIPENTDLVVVGNVKTIVESAGGKIDNGGFVNGIKQSFGLSADGSTVELPSYITDNLTGKDENKIEEIQEFLKDGGIDVNACALAFNYEDPEPTVILSILNEEGFIKAIKDNDYDHEKEKDGIEFYKKTMYASEYGSEENFIAIYKGYAYFLPEVWSGSDFDAVKHLRRFISDAGDKSFASTKFADYITSGNAVGLSAKMPKRLRDELVRGGMPKRMADMYDGVVCMKSNLDSEAATVSVKFFDKDGSEKLNELAKAYCNTEATINPKALSYLGDDEVLVTAVACKDMKWDKYFDDMFKDYEIFDRTELSLIKAYLEKFDGTVAFGIGVRDGIRSFGRVDANESLFMQEIPFTLVCETRAGKAQSVIGDLKALLDKQGVSYSNASDGIRVDVPETTFSFYLEAKGDMLVLSNHKIKSNNDNPTVSSVTADKSSAFFALVLNKDNALMEQLGVENTLQVLATADAKTFETSMTIRMDGDEGDGIIGKIAKAIMGMVDNEQELSRTVREAKQEVYESTYEAAPVDTIVDDEPAYPEDYAY